ncbi:molybdopterin biosynthesis protein MoeY [Janthinobacterium sp. BJB412]|nr:molybdopterin biosynthesis protein MoeY [Janthinobacterium sp. BJB412]
MTTRATIEQILELARWAPSGDNVQSHRFQIVAPDHLVVHARDTSADTVYDLDGHPSQLAFGALLETIAIAASGHGLRAEAARRPLDPADPTLLLFDVRFAAAPGLAADPLIGCIVTRSVQRRPLSSRPLSGPQKAALAAALQGRYTVRWLEGFGQRLAAARLMYNNAKLRLTMPEAYEVHHRIIDWEHRLSPDRVPAQALGVDAATQVLMKWAMVSWRRLARVNALMGTWAPRLQMDFLPGLACAAHFVLEAAAPAESIDDYVAAGRAVQRFWLTAELLDLRLQPELTPLIFSRYVRERRRFTRVEALYGLAAGLERQAAALLFAGPGHPVFMGRLGAGKAAPARSVRKPLAQLLLP